MSSSIVAAAFESSQTHDQRIHEQCLSSEQGVGALSAAALIARRVQAHRVEAHRIDDTRGGSGVNKAPRGVRVGLGQVDQRDASLALQLGRGWEGAHGP
eukprot:1254917-Pleurochrysis_carterae.AAC.6